MKATGLIECLALVCPFHNGDTSIHSVGFQSRRIIMAYLRAVYLAYLLAFYLALVFSHALWFFFVASDCVSQRAGRHQPLWHTVWHYIWHIFLAFYLAYLLVFYRSPSGILSGIMFGILCGIILWHSICIYSGILFAYLPAKLCLRVWARVSSNFIALGCAY